MTKEYNKNPGKGNTSTSKFDIRQHVEFDHNGRAVCPNCGTEGGKRDLSVLDNGAYKCFKCDDTEAIREALGFPKQKIIPTALAKPAQKKPKYLVPEATILKNATQLFSGQGKYSLPALNWLKERGIIPEIAREFKLGLARSRVEGDLYWSISIPIPSEGKYYQKKRLVPWDKDNPVQDIRPWSQASIPKMVYFTHLPEQAKETWLCEGEWDAILLGWLVKHFQPEGIAVGCFTCGCKTIPGKAELDRLPGQVKIFYDRNDKLIKGKRAGEEGAKKLAQALGDRGEIALVPMPDHCTTQGWDVSDALNYGYRFEEFELAASQASNFLSADKPKNKFRDKLVSARTIFDRAPDYVEELWTDFFACNEMYLLAAPPRLGKSLFTLALAKAIATGTEFLGRPTKKGKVILVSKEDAEDKLKERMIAQTWGDEEFDNISFQNDFTLDDLPDLIEYLEQEKPALLVLDTLSRIRTDNLSENDSKLSTYLSPLQDAAQKNNVCVIVVHHTTKGGLITESREEIFNKVRGTGSLRGVCRGMVVLTEGKDCTRLVAENGRSEPKDLKIKLNPDNLIWKQLGKWNPPQVDISQKDQVLDWLVNHQSGQVVQIAKELNIQTKTIHKILTRLVSENLARKEGQRLNTLYYASEFDKFRHTEAYVEIPNPDPDRDLGDNSTNRQVLKNLGSEIKSDQNCNEMLQSLITDHQNPEKNNFVDLSNKKGKSIDVQGKNRFRQNSTKFTLSNSKNTSVINDNGSLICQTDHFGHVTKNFEETVISEPNDKGFEPGDKVSGNCTNTKIDEWTGTVESINGEMASVTWSDGSSNLVGLDLLKKIE